ncbi:MAG: pantetheine-phosphate adenylyltransferase [Anaerolineaceae bacterium]|nr:pantetheine-phosphate adenylyltransferase [Anaerolineaceae bacterium]|tara:strand:- start:26417 stop:26923 length:507 start_codon:yes stop_codon:yes gene_type:complete
MALKAVFPGTFDPIHYGHIDIVKRGCALFDEVVVAVYNRPLKNLLFSRHERMQLVQEACLTIDNVIIKSYDGLTVDFCDSVDAKIILRGLRVFSDFEHEFRMALANRRLAHGIDTVSLITSEKHTFLSSSTVREIATLGGDVSSMVPDFVLEALEKKLAQDYAKSEDV